MAISRPATATAAAATSVTPPAHVIADMLIGYAYRNGSNTAPTLPTDTTVVQLATAGANTNSIRVWWKWADSTGESGGTAANATHAIVACYRGAKGFGAIGGPTAASGNSLSYTGATKVNSGNDSWWVGIGSHRTASNVETAPSGMFNVVSVGSGPESALHDTNGPVSGWSTAAAGVNASSGNYTLALELLPYSIFNPFHKNSKFTLSNGNLTATQDTADGSDSSAFCSFPRSPFGGGKWYFTMTAGASVNGSVAICAFNNPTTGFPAETGIEYTDGGGVFAAGAGQIDTYPTMQAGDVVGVAYDADTEDVWFRIHRSGSWGNWNNSGSADPSTGVGGIDASAISSVGTGNTVPAIGGSGGGTGHSWTYNGTNPSGVPTGFDPWDGPVSGGYILDAAAGSFAWSGGAATLRVARKLQAVSGSFGWAGGAAALRAGRKLVGAAGSFAWAGSAATLRAARKLIVSTGAFVWTGGDAAFDVSGEGTGYTLVAESGPFTGTGSNAMLRASRRLTAASGPFAWAGAAATPRATRKLEAASGAFAWTGGAAVLRASRKLAAAAGAFVVTGGATMFLRGKIFVAAIAAFIVTGSAATLRVARKLLADAGLYMVAGQDTAFEIEHPFRWEPIPENPESWANEAADSTTWTEQGPGMTPWDAV